MKSAGLFKYVSFLLPPGIKGLISCNSFRNVNMCLLEVAMCEKCKSCHFQLDGVSKNFEDWGVGLKSFRTGWANNLGGGYFCWGVSTALHDMVIITSI